MAETAQLSVARAYLDSYRRLTTVPLYRGHTIYHHIDHDFHHMKVSPAAQAAHCMLHALHPPPPIRSTWGAAAARPPPLMIHFSSAWATCMPVLTPQPLAHDPSLPHRSTASFSLSPPIAPEPPCAVAMALLLLQLKLMPRPEGWGLRCSGLLYELCGVVGLRNVSAKLIGRRKNKFFVAQVGGRGWG